MTRIQGARRTRRSRLGRDMTPAQTSSTLTENGNSLLMRWGLSLLPCLSLCLLPLPCALVPPAPRVALGSCTYLLTAMGTHQILLKPQNVLFSLAARMRRRSAKSDPKLQARQASRPLYAEYKFFLVPLRATWPRQGGDQSLDCDPASASSTAPGSCALVTQHVTQDTALSRSSLRRAVTCVVCVCGVAVPVSAAASYSSRGLQSGARAACECEDHAVRTDIIARDSHMP